MMWENPNPRQKWGKRTRWFVWQDFNVCAQYAHSSFKLFFLKLSSQHSHLSFDSLKLCFTFMLLFVI